MRDDKTVAVIIPCYNEESQIDNVLRTLPKYIDKIFVINDCSTDETKRKVLDLIPSFGSFRVRTRRDSYIPNFYNGAEAALIDFWERTRGMIPQYEIYNANPQQDRLILVDHVKNSGKGAGIVTGYYLARQYGMDCTITIDGDGQMDPSEMSAFCDAIIKDGVDYVKGNRLVHPSARLVIPKIRFVGNSVLSIMTKFASGYWDISDTQTGYTAIGKSALEKIDIHKIYSSYGYPNDVLVKLNIRKCTIREIEIKPVYNVGEQSSMNIRSLIPKITLLLIRSFFRRVYMKYLFNDFHPLFVLYNIALFMGLINTYFISKIAYIKLFDLRIVSGATISGFIFTALSGLLCFLFAIWMDIQDNEKYTR